MKLALAVPINVDETQSFDIRRTLLPHDIRRYTNAYNHGDGRDPCWDDENQKTTVNN